MKEVTAEEAWGVLTEAGYKLQFEGGWKEINAGAPGRRLVGRVVTAVFMPLRPDLNGAINKAAAAEARVAKGQNSWVIDTLQPGDVLVVDLFGKIDKGTFIGDNLGTSIFAKTGKGVVVDGSVRDVSGILEIRGLPRIRARLPPDRPRRRDPRRHQRADPDRRRDGAAGRRDPERPRGAHLRPAAPRGEGRDQLRGRALPGRLGPRDAAAGQVHAGAGRLASGRTPWRPSSRPGSRRGRAKNAARPGRGRGRGGRRPRRRTSRGRRGRGPRGPGPGGSSRRRRAGSSLPRGRAGSRRRAPGSA